MRDFFQSMLHNKVIMACVSIVFGTFLIVGRGSAVADIIRILGIFLLVAAVTCFITYFFGSQSKGNPSTLATAILCTLVSLVFIYAPGWLIDLFPIVMGLALIVNSIFNISGLVSSPIRTGMFTASMVLSCITLVLGFVAVLHPSAVADVLIVLIGITYLLNGIDDLLAIAVLG